MNRRIYKKRAKRARDVLLELGVFREGAFDAARRGDECGFDLFGIPEGADPLKGTPSWLSGTIGRAIGMLNAMFRSCPTCCTGTFRKGRYAAGSPLSRRRGGSYASPMDGGSYGGYHNPGLA